MHCDKKAAADGACSASKSHVLSLSVLHTIQAARVGSTTACYGHSGGILKLVQGEEPESFFMGSWVNAFLSTVFVGEGRKLQPLTPVMAGLAIDPSFRCFLPSSPDKGQGGQKLHLLHPVLCQHDMLNIWPPSDTQSNSSFDSGLVWLERSCTENALPATYVSVSLGPKVRWDMTLLL